MARQLTGEVVVSWAATAYAASSALMVLGLFLPWEPAGGRSSFELVVVAGRLGLLDWLPLLAARAGLVAAPTFSVVAITVSRHAGPLLFRSVGVLAPLVTLGGSVWAFLSLGLLALGPLVASVGALSSLLCLLLPVRSADYALVPGRL